MLVESAKAGHWLYE
ncbi:hypothetical protein ACI0X1_003165 [Cronobacter sakazakii]